MFNAELGITVVFGLIAVVVVNVGFAYLLAKLSDRRIAAELVKADKRLKDQINSRVG